MPRTLANLRALLRRRPLFAALVGLPSLWIIAVVSGLYLTLGRLVASWSPGSDVWFFGRDFSVFYVGGSLARRGDWSVLYDLAAFTTRFNEVTGLDLPAGGPVFRYPPPTAFAYAPLSVFPLEVALAVWTIAGIAAYAVAVHLLRLAPWVAIVALASIPAYAVVALGQNTFFALLVFSAATVAARRGQPLWLGIILGLLVLKPQLALGPALWWLSAPSRHRRELVGAFMSGGSILVLTALTAPDGWSAYLKRLPALADPGSFNRTWYFSGLDFFRTLFADESIAPFVWVAWVVVLLVGTLLVLRRVGDDLPVALATAVVVSLLVSPHVVVYDWLLLAVPGAILWDRTPRARLAGGAVALNLVALYGPDLAARQAQNSAAVFHPAYPLLVVVALLALWPLAAPSRNGVTGGSATESSLQPADPPSTSRRNFPV